MKLDIKQNILLEHLNYVIKGISTKNIIPILNCIKFELDDNGLYLTSTDNDIAIKTFISNEKIEKIERYGKIVVSGRYIYEIVRKLPNEIISIEEVVDNKIFITTKNTSFNLNCSNPQEFPSIDLNDHKSPITLKQGDFKNIIRETIFATSTQESRPVLTGLNFIIDGKSLICTGTDSYRLAKTSIEVESNLDEDVNIIIPTRNLNELLKLLTEDNENVELHIFNNKVIFKFNTIIMMTRLINGSYPDTSKLIPNEFSLEILLKYNDFFESIDRASLLTNEADKNTIKLETKENKAIISSNIPEIGYVEEVVDIKKSVDTEIKIAFSSKFMIDALKALNGEEIQLKFNGEIKPIIIKNPEYDELIQLILPIRTY